MSGIVLAGWICPACRCFNGEEVKPAHVCRSCGDAKPAKPDPTGLGRDVLIGALAEVTRENVCLRANLTKTQERCTELLEQVRSLTSGVAVPPRCDPNTSRRMAPEDAGALLLPEVKS